MKPEPGKMNAEGLVGVDPVKCPECGYRMDTIGHSGGKAQMPSPGDPVACMKCGAVMTYEAGRLRGFTEKEMDELIADTEAMDHLALHVKRIHFLRHGLN